MQLEIQKYLYDIISSINSINEYLGEDRDFIKYKTNKLLRRGIERELEIIGEAEISQPVAFCILRYSAIMLIHNFHLHCAGILTIKKAKVKVKVKNLNLSLNLSLNLNLSLSLNLSLNLSLSLNLNLTPWVVRRSSYVFPSWFQIKEIYSTFDLWT